MIHFQIHYHTAANQQICICGSTSEFGNFDESKALVLSNNGDRWFAEIEIDNITACWNTSFSAHSHAGFLLYIARICY